MQKSLAASALLAFAVPLLFAQAGAPPAAPPQAPPYNCEPVNPNATPEARALLKTLCAASGKGILTGQHNFPNQRDLDTDKVYRAHRQVPGDLGLGLRIHSTARTRTPSCIAT